MKKLSDYNKKTKQTIIAEQIPEDDMPADMKRDEAQEPIDPEARFRKLYKAANFLAAVHWFICLLLEWKVFEKTGSINDYTYVLCKVFLFVILMYFWRFVLKAIAVPEKERKMLYYAIPALAVLAIWLLLNNPMRLNSEEVFLYQNAVQLNSSSDIFGYVSGFCWIISMMLVPLSFGAHIVKIFLMALICGYVLARQSEVSDSKNALLMYILFAIPAVLDFGICADSLAIYGSFLLLFTAKLFYDHKEEVELSLKSFLWVAILNAVLVIGRPEGILMLVLGPVMIFFAYNLSFKGEGSKDLVGKLVMYLILVAIAILPQYKTAGSMFLPISFGGAELFTDNLNIIFSDALMLCQFILALCCAVIVIVIAAVKKQGFILVSALCGLIMAAALLLTSSYSGESMIPGCIVPYFHAVAGICTLAAFNSFNKAPKEAGKN